MSSHCSGGPWEAVCPNSRGGQLRGGPLTQSLLLAVASWPAMGGVPLPGTMVTLGFVLDALTSGLCIPGQDRTSVNIPERGSPPPTVRWLPGHIECVGKLSPLSVAVLLREWQRPHPLCCGGKRTPQNSLRPYNRQAGAAWTFPWAQGAKLGYPNPHPSHLPPKNPWGAPPAPRFMVGTTGLPTCPGPNWEGRAGPTHLTQIPQTSLSVPNTQVTHQGSRLPVPTLKLTLPSARTLGEEA